MYGLYGLMSFEREYNIKGEQLHKDISYPKSVGLSIRKYAVTSDYAFTNLKIMSKINKIAIRE